MRKPKATQCVTDPSCTEKIHARDMCLPHYNEFRREHPELIRYYGPRDESVESKLLRHVKSNPDTGCWEKIGWVNGGGYGQIWINGKFEYMHRLSYEVYVGPIPEGLELDHLCSNRACSNWEHLEPVTHQENMRRGNGQAGRNFRKTHCKYGHEFTPENTILDDRGARQCFECRAIKRRAA